MNKLNFSIEIQENKYINPFLHSVFGEYIGTLIYDGTWVGRESDIPNVEGIRKDLIEGFKEAGIAAIRWPGGCTADHYHWRDGISKNRKNRMPFSTSQLGSFCNEYGTDEFIKLCRLTGAEPIIVANVATGTPEEFQDWFEYCNGDRNTKYGAIREENGNIEPYNVKLWGIGNTDENVWHIAYNDPKEYARNFRKWRTTILGSADKVKLIGIGLSQRHETYGWVESFLDYTTSDKRQKGPDSLSVHHYIGGMKARYYECGGAVDFSDYGYYFTLDSLKAYQLDIDLHKKYIEEHTNTKYKTSVCFDEWGLWHPEATDKNGLRQNQTMRDAIFAACCFHLFYRNSDVVEFAMETQYANVLQSLFETEGELFYRTPTFYVFKLFKDHLKNYMLPITLNEDNKYLDYFASADENLNSVIITIVNKHLTEAYELDLSSLCEKYEVTKSDIIAPDNVRDFNSFSNPNIINDKIYDLRGLMAVRLPKHSILRLKLQKKSYRITRGQRNCTKKDNN